MAFVLAVELKTAVKAASALSKISLRVLVKLSVIAELPCWPGFVLSVMSRLVVKLS